MTKQATEQREPAWEAGWHTLERGRFGAYDGTWHDEDAAEWRYRLRWDFTTPRRPECVGIDLRALGGQPLTSGKLRELPIGELMAIARRALVVNVEALQAVRAAHDLGNDQLVADVKRWEREGRSGPRGYGTDHFENVASIYREAAIGGNRPTTAVSEHFQVSKSAAAKWVARARGMKLLPPAQKGKIG